MKTLLKDLLKTKTLLKEKISPIARNEIHLFGKKFCSHIIKIERSKKQSLEVFKGTNEENILFQTFKKTLYQNRPQGGGDTITRKTQAIETKTKYSISEQRECKCQKVPLCTFSIKWYILLL